MSLATSHFISYMAHRALILLLFSNRDSQLDLGAELKTGASKVFAHLQQGRDKACLSRPFLPLRGAFAKSMLHFERNINHSLRESQAVIFCAYLKYSHDTKP